MDAIREAAAQFPTCVVFMMANQRNIHLQEVRKLWKDNSRIFVGKNRVMAKALGTDPESEVRPGLSEMAKRLAGPVGVLFTTSPPSEVQQWFQDHGRDDFARSGSSATQTIVLEQGPVMIAIDPPEQLPHSLEPQLRALGMPTELKRGVPTLLEQFVVCKKGEKLTSEKAQILKHLLIKDATFRLIPVAYWTYEEEEVQDFALEAADQILVDAHRRSLKKIANRGPSNRNSNSGKVGDVGVHASDDDDDSMENDDDEDDDVDENIIDARERAMMLPVGV